MCFLLFIVRFNSTLRVDTLFIASFGIHDVLVNSAERLREYLVGVREQ